MGDKQKIGISSMSHKKVKLCTKCHLYTKAAKDNLYLNRLSPLKRNSNLKSAVKANTSLCILKLRGTFLILHSDKNIVIVYGYEKSMEIKKSIS